MIYRQCYQNPTQRIWNLIINMKTASNDIEMIILHDSRWRPLYATIRKWCVTRTIRIKLATLPGYIKECQLRISFQLKRRIAVPIETSAIYLRKRSLYNHITPRESSAQCSKQSENAMLKLQNAYPVYITMDNVITTTFWVDHVNCHHRNDRLTEIVLWMC